MNYDLKFCVKRDEGITERERGGGGFLSSPWEEGLQRDPVLTGSQQLQMKRAAPLQTAVCFRLCDVWRGVLLTLTLFVLFA